MKVLMTGANGTVGTVLRKHLTSRGAEVVAWDRGEVPVDDYHAMEAFVRRVQPEVLFHLAIASQNTGRENESWLVNYHWSSELAWICRMLGIVFVFTSTVMVFSDNAPGPFTIDSPPDAREGYGYEKRRAEERVGYQNPDARVLRLGWQIGEAPGSNNMIDFFEQKMREDGKIAASTRWYPACSFLPDTAAALAKVAGMSPGLYQADSNRRWNFFEIATALNQRHGNRWDIVSTDDFVYDQRMIDPRLNLPALSERLPELI